MHAPTNRRTLPDLAAALTMDDSPMTPVQAEILHQEQARLFGRIAGGRVMAIPVIVGLVLTVVLVEPLGWRTVVLAAAATAVVVFFIVELVRYRKSGMTSSALPVNIGTAVIGQMVVSAVTGGLASPFLFVAIPLGTLVGVFLSRRLVLLLTAFQVVSMWVLAYVAHRGLVPDMNLAVFGGGSAVAAPPAFHYAQAAGLSLVAVGSGQIGRVIHDVFGSALRRSLDAQQDSLDAHADQVRALTALSGEIAHELKNPLASVKGLSALLTQNIADDKGKERLAVLRHEVDRMQSVLEEFLNFSRPLVPLSVVCCDVAQVGLEVAGLHEGIAQERGVRIELTGERSLLSCDPRKLKQILINLVQNALEASPPRSTLVIDTRSNPSDVVVSILDRGRGISLEPETLFEPGVTTKANGTGVGLTIARALARQHGGELTLRERSGGGTVATLSLPLEPKTEKPKTEPPADEAS